MESFEITSNIRIKLLNTHQVLRDVAWNFMQKTVD